MEKTIYTKEELSAAVHVPALVEEDIKRIISDRLETCGMYFRVFSRIKTAGSMARKFEMKAYSPEHRLQDLVGARINLYFDDDVNICRSIMEQTFEVVDFSASERSEDEFKPIKMNLVCRLPEYLKAQISPDTWDMCIDDTFEIQIKTILSEGWHEIEHDMRYKGEELWEQHPALSRYFNSILATLELCDKSMVTLFEDLGHEMYKTGLWSDMIRSHFRLKLEDMAMYPEVEQVLAEDQQDENGSALAKRIYKTSRERVMQQFLKRTRRVPVNVNTIVALINDSELHDSRLTAIFRERDVYSDGREDIVGESRHYELKPLFGHSVFRMRTWVDGNRLDEEARASKRAIFDKAAAGMYHWAFAKYSTLFRDMPPVIASYEADMTGYHVLVAYEPERCYMKMLVRHIDLEVGGRVWFSNGILSDCDGRLLLTVNNGYAEPRKENAGADTGGRFFSYPGYYKSVVDNVGIFNGIHCMNRRRIVSDKMIPQLEAALNDVCRTFPIILIVSKETADGMMDEEWLGQLRVSDFTRTVWRYAHVFTSYEKTGRELLARRGITPAGDEDIPRLYIFWPDGDVDSYGPEDIRTCSYGRHLEARDDARTYDIVYGGQAFYHKLVTELREYNAAHTPLCAPDRAAGPLPEPDEV